MTVFIAIAVVMIVAAVAWLLVPLLGRRPPLSGPAPEAANLEILRDQLAELEADVVRGTLARERAGQARADLERRALEEAQGAAASAGAASPSGARSAAVLGATIPVGALLLYLALGTPSALLPGAEPQHGLTAERVEQMVARLAARLEQAPDDVEGWRVLGRSYAVMGRYQEASRAYERAAVLTPGDADLLADYADALAMAQGRSMQGKPLELVKRALALDAKQWKALALAGSAAFERKDYTRAIAYWRQVLQVVPPDSEIARSADASIAEARALAGGKPAARSAQAPAAGKVAGRISLAPQVAARAAPTDSVFVFARAAGGPPMPLAILRKQVRDLPLEFTLDDSMAMAPSLKLSDFPEVIIGARVSRSGNATPQSGDLQGLSKPVKVGATGIVVVIDTAVP